MCCRIERIRTRLFVFIISSLMIWVIFISNEVSDKEVFNKREISREFRDDRFGSIQNTTDEKPFNKISLQDIIMTVRTTTKNADTRMKALFESWLPSAFDRSDYIYVFSDGDDQKVSNRVPDGHFINTKCGKEHTRKDLCCKMSKELTFFTGIDKKWYCLFDDDMYLNVDNLVTLLRDYDYNGLWYIGKNDRETKPHYIPRQKYRNVTFWFHNRGSGICLSRGLFEKMKPIIREDGFAQLAPSIGLLDDLVLGFIINHILKVNPTHIDLFHSQWEKMADIENLEKQITLGYKEANNNYLNVGGFSKAEDPYRFRSLHCKLHPEDNMCRSLWSLNSGSSIILSSILPCLHISVFVAFMIS